MFVEINYISKIPIEIKINYLIFMKESNDNQNNYED